MSSSGALPSNLGELRYSSLLGRALKYSVHLDSCSASVVRVFPFMSLTGVVVCRGDFLDSCFVML